MNMDEIGATLNRAVEQLIRFKLLGASILGAFVMVAGLIIATGPESEPQLRIEKAWPVSVKSVEPQSLAPTLIAFGRVESRQLASLKTSISAPVEEMLASEGDWVHKGDVIIKLRDDEYLLALKIAQAEQANRRAQLESAIIEFELAKKITGNHEELKSIADAKLQRHQDLYANKMVSNAALDNVRREASERAIALERHFADLKVLPTVIKQREASVAEAEALVDKARLDLAQTKLRAPFHGRIISTLVAPGDRSIAGSALVIVANYDNLEVRTSIPADLGYKIRYQLENGVTVNARGFLDDREIQLELHRLSGDVKSGQSGIDAFFVASQNEVLDIGRVVNLQITLPPETGVVALPVQSLYERGRVYRVNDDRLEGIDVEQVGDYIDASGVYRLLVRSDEIRPGDKLITTQLPRAITGLLVDPIEVDNLEQALAAKVSLADGSEGE